MGSAGRLLNAMLSDAGLDRKQCYITNVVKVRPPNNNFDIFYEDKKQEQPTKLLQKFREQLYEELRTIRPHVIIALGNEALKALTGKSGITKWRGSVLETPFGKVVPTIHPGNILRVYTQRVVSTMDLRRAKDESAFRELRSVPDTKFLIDPTFEQVMEWLGTVGPEHSEVTFDVETVGGFKSGKPLFVRCIGLARSPYEACVIPLMRSSNSTVLGNGNGGARIQFSQSSPTLGSRWSEVEEWAILKELYRIFADPEIELTAQNAPFDCQVLEKEFGFRFANLAYDTMLMHHTVYCELPKSLDFLTSMYTTYGYYADYDVSVDREVWVYNGYDVVATFACKKALLKELEETDLLDFYQHHIHPAMIALTRTQDRGIKVDLEKREQLRVQTEQELVDLQAKVEQMTEGQIVKPNSPKDVPNYFFKTLRLPIEKNPQTGRPTTNEIALERIERKNPDLSPLIRAILDWRGKRVLLSTFINSRLTADGFMRTSYNLAGTTTGRVSSSETYEGIGGNLQNIPKGSFRKLYTPRPGHKFLKCDLSQAEFRFVVWDAPITRLIEKYEQDQDFDAHTWSACLVYNIEEDRVHEQVRDDSPMTFRDFAKNGNYGGNYDMKPKRASGVWKVPYKEAEYLLNRREEALPEIKMWHKKIQERLNHGRTLTNPLGRKRIFLDRVDENMYREAYSHSAQSTVADILNRSILILDYILPESECRCTLQVHDEILFEVKEDREAIARYGRIIKNVMEYPVVFPEVDVPLVIPCDQEVGDNWYDKTELSEWLEAQAE